MKSLNDEQKGVGSKLPDSFLCRKKFCGAARSYAINSCAIKVCPNNEKKCHRNCHGLLDLVIKGIIKIADPNRFRIAKFIVTEQFVGIS